MLWGYVFGVTVASSAYTYDRIYPTAADRASLARTFGANHAAAALFGPAPRLDTVAGFTAFKASMTLMVVGAAWGLLTGTRLLRGDEDAGRWEILLGGATTRRGAVAQVLAGLGAAALALWAVTGLLTAVVGRLASVRFDVSASLYLALALVATAVMFLAVGAVTSQLAATRRQAAGYAAAVLGASYGLRMVGDAGTGAHWLVWVSPLGWVEELRPLTGPRPWALLPIGAFSAAVALAAVWLGGRRDLGSSTFPGRSSRPARLALLSGPTAFTLRLSGPPALWWAGGTVATGLLMGAVAKSAGATMAGSSVQQVFSRLGARGSGTATFLAVAFSILAMVVAFEAASLVGAARAEEAEGRLDHLVSGAVRRARWFLGRFAVAGAALAASAVTAGVAVWVGTASQGPGPGAGTAVAAGVNAAVPAVFLLGVGALGLGLRPRLATAGVYVVLGWSALVELLGGFFSQSRWLLDTSVFHQLAGAPSVAPAWGTDAVVAGLGLAALAVGCACFVRRDLAGA